METKSVMLLVLATLIAFASIAYAIEIGVARFNADASFLEDVSVIGTISGSRNLRIGEGIDFVDVNGTLRYSSYVEFVDESIPRAIPDDLNSIFVFESATVSSAFNIGWIFWNSMTERPTFVIEDGFVGRGNIFERSLIIGKQKGLADISVNYNTCPLGVMDLADCDTALTGADLIVEDDIENFGSTKVHENLIVDGNSFITLIYGSMFQHAQGTQVVLTDTTSFFPIKNMQLDLANGFDINGTESLRALEVGVYKTDWNISFVDQANIGFIAGVIVDGNIQLSTLSHVTTLNPNHQVSTGSTGLVVLDVNSLVSLGIKTDNTTTIDLQHANLTLFRVGN